MDFLYSIISKGWFFIVCIIIYYIYFYINKYLEKRGKEKLAQLLNIFDKRAEIEEFLTKNPDILIFRNIAIDYNSNPNLLDRYKRDLPINEKIKILEYHTSKQNIFYKKYVYSSCEHGIQYAIISPANCSSCYYDFIKWKENIELQARRDKDLKQKEQAEKKRLKEIYDRKNALEKYKKKIQFGKMKSEEVGAAYERYVGYYFESLGYDVEYNGIKKGKKDAGIDLFVKNKNVICLVQCKRYKENSSVHENTLTQLIGTLNLRRVKNPNQKYIALLCTSYDNIDDDIRDGLKYYIDVSHEVIPMKYDYPMVKCNIGKKGQKIYHLPVIGMYDRIKINIKKGEKYVYTIEEAEELGFRPASTTNTKNKTQTEELDRLRNNEI